jgi:hypothetical protein
VELLDAPAIDAGGNACRGRACACEDGVDNDGDGTVDGLDTACTSALDDDEAGFGMGPLRPNTCLDCFFDTNEGADDGCRYPESCRASGVPSTCGVCDESVECAAACRPRVPNGCDCFGCCAVEQGGTARTVELIDGCTVDGLDDPTRCPPCVQATWCRNECTRCEWCPGRTSLPDDCAPSCSDGESVCSPDLPCEAAQVCVLGCCLLRP